MVPVAAYLSFIPLIVDGEKFAKKMDGEKSESCILSDCYDLMWHSF